MHRNRMRLTCRLSLLGGVLAAVLAGCATSGTATPASSPSSSADSPSPSPTPTGPLVAPAGYVAVLKSEASDLATTNVSGRQNVVMGPFFRHEVGAVGVVSAISAEQARADGLPQAVKAADGQELVVTVFSGSTSFTVPTVNGGTAAGGAPVHEQEPVESVVVDGHARPVKTPLEDGEALVVSVPKGHRAFLHLTQAGVTQSVDLRTGQRIADASTPYYPNKDLSYGKYPEYWDGKAPLLGVRTSLTNVDATMSPFSPTGTWAAKGKAWVYLSLRAMSVCSTNAPDCRVTMARHDIALVLPNGDRVYPTAGDAFMTSVGLSDIDPDGKKGLGSFGFQVPASLRTATLAVTFGHKVSVVKGSKSLSLTMSTPPGPTRIKLTL
ncbi:hypothetical protein ACXJJ3_27045 [Kribbella sp. WER1]